ncbi:hypothetical protein FB384_004478 [Prauserella sediminis]|uniref:Uncharacterized protein n=1 Tax=Prauserella sediminis TaxID=577680 RepID=A0A839XQM6_9PSEU|nr:hypothetical protein [Prauserella sediminis]MBB3665520.1 hypothetical protein [Prauserella sediminis]
MSSKATDEAQFLVGDLAERLQRSVVVADSRLELLCNSAHFGDEDSVRVYALRNRSTLSKAIVHTLAQGAATWPPASFRAMLHLDCRRGSALRSDGAATLRSRCWHPDSPMIDAAP